ncbi:MAG: protein kinase, partial [Myxococcota bacterium]
MVRILQQVLMALVAAHESGRQLIHRDIKPDNILVTDVAGRADFTKVLDFGISKALEGTGIGTGSIVGSPHTMAPEQWKGEQVTPATDLYAVGCTAYIALSGRLPFDGKGVEVGLAHVSQPPPDLMPWVDEDTPEAVVDWVAWLMRKQPAHRPQTAQQALEVLRTINHGTSQVSLPSYTPHVMERIESSAPPVNLPRFASSFVGRERELFALDQLVSEGANLVTLHGIGGLGKTRLSVEWANTCYPDFPGGCYFCDLAEATSLNGVCLYLAQALEIPLNKDAPVQTLGYALSGRGRVLVIFDNFEQVVDYGSSSIGVWLEMAPEAMFVVTSRRQVGLDGERVVNVQPLQTPTTDQQETIQQSEAVRLFVARAKQTRGDFELTQHNAHIIAHLVRQLDGLPLTIEMAASRVRTLTPAGIVSRLSDRFRLLRSSRRDVSGRQMTLLATLDWSWELLTAYEQAAFAQCAVFQGSFSLEAAEAVVDLAEYAATPWVMDVIESLIDKSLIQVADHRLTMFVSVHQYAATKLQCLEDDAQEDVRERHLEYFAQYGQHTFLKQLDLNKKALDELEMELGNLDAALSYASESDRFNLAGLCALALGEYFIRQGLFDVGLVKIRPVLNRSTHNTIRLRLMHLFGDLNRAGGRLGEARHRLEEALHMARDSGEQHLEGKLLCGLGSVLREQGQP